MLTQFYIPQPALREFVQCIMIVQVTADTSKGPVICLYPPAPQDSLFFYLDDLIEVKKNSGQQFVKQPRSVVVGTQLEGVSININRSHKAVRVGFHPGGMYRLLGIHMPEIIDNSYNAEDVFGKEMHVLNEHLTECKTFDEIKSEVEKYLLSRLCNVQRGLPFDKVMCELVSRGGLITVDQAAAMACVSIRQFERISKQRIGMSPKLYARLVRFSRAYRMREKFAHLTWTHIAYQCHYFDQMHFIRDFKFFSGFTPSFIDKELEASAVRLQATMKL